MSVFLPPIVCEIRAQVRISGVLNHESNVPIEKADKPFLGKVPVMRQDFLNLFLPHDVHRDAVHQAVLLIGTSLVERQPGKKRLVRLGNHFDARVVENLPHQPASQSARLVAVTGDRRQEFAQHFFRGDQQCVGTIRCAGRISPCVAGKKYG